MSIRNITIGSLFSGVGGLERGLEMAGLGPTRWQVEHDEFCRTILSQHWPEATRFGDIRTVDVAQLEPVDLVCGGPPCQAASIAGKRRGQSDPRWLWPEFARVLRGVRPRYVALENVPGLLTVDRGAAFGAILRDLAALGYDAWWDVLAAAEAGAPHKRDRLFVLAWLADADGQRQHQPSEPVQVPRGRIENGGERPDQPCVGRNANGLSYWIHRGWPAGRGQRPYPYEPPRSLAEVPDRRKRLKALGNAVVPQLAMALGTIILEKEGLQ